MPYGKRGVPEAIQVPISPIEEVCGSDVL